MDLLLSLKKEILQKQVLRRSKVLLEKGTWNTGIMSENTKLQLILILIMKWKPLTLTPCSELIGSGWVLVGFGWDINTCEGDGIEKVLSVLLVVLDWHTHTLTHTLLWVWWHLWLSLSPSALAVAVVPAQLLSVCPCPAQSREGVHPSAWLPAAFHTPHQCCQPKLQALNWATPGAGTCPTLSPSPEDTDAGQAERH